MKNKVNNTSSGAVVSRQSIIKWLLILLLGMQLASFVSNLTVSLLLGRGGSPGSSFRMNWLDTDDEYNTVIEANLLRSLMNGSTEYRGVKRYTQYAITYERLIKNRNPFVRVVKKKIVIKEVNDVTSFKYPIDIGPCKIRDKGLFIGVISAPPNFKRRRDIRRTWLRHLNDKRMMEANNSVNIVGFGFILGQTNDTQVQTRIEKESRTHGDILQVQIMDANISIWLSKASLSIIGSIIIAPEWISSSNWTTMSTWIFVNWFRFLTNRLFQRPLFQPTSSFTVSTKLPPHQNEVNDNLQIIRDLLLIFFMIYFFCLVFLRR